MLSVPEIAVIRLDPHRLHATVSLSTKGAERSELHAFMSETGYLTVPVDAEPGKPLQHRGRPPRQPPAWGQGGRTRLFRFSPESDSETVPFPSRADHPHCVRRGQQSCSPGCSGGSCTWTAIELNAWSHSASLPTVAADGTHAMHARVRGESHVTIVSFVLESPPLKSSHE